MLGVTFSHECPLPRRALTTSRDGSFVLWDLAVRWDIKEEPKPLARYSCPEGEKRPYERAALGPDGVLALAAGALVRFHDPKTGQVLGEIPQAHSGRLTDMCFCPETRQTPQGMRSVLMTAGADQRVRLWMAPALP